MIMIFIILESQCISWFSSYSLKYRKNHIDHHHYTVHTHHNIISLPTHVVIAYTRRYWYRSTNLHKITHAAHHLALSIYQATK